MCRIDATVGDVIDAVEADWTESEIDARFGDTWRSIHASLRRLYTNISTRYCDIVRSGLLVWLSECLPSDGPEPPITAARPIPLVEIEQQLRHACRLRPQNEHAQPERPDSEPIGFMGVSELSEWFKIPADKRAAFTRQLNRMRSNKLLERNKDYQHGERGCWQYRADSEAIRQISLKYKL